ncbi:MAG: UDP-N-acetylmuramoyl-tripeptide--D-alanyl-D-alanine ligase, partial [Solobacterium sp.]|nr:UDP-N-acetylmuramoyl-tripeptide--D-alanyl-D-alanine ligase [Solobacterium sp.]
MLSVVKMVLFVSAMLVPAKHALHIFQQNSYIVSRYLEWLKENALLRIKAAWLPVCATLIFRYPVPALVFLLMYGLYTEHKASYRKPLVYTARVKRQIAVEAVLVLILCAVLLKLRADAFLPALSLILPWLLVIPVGWITAPIERGVQQSFLNDAKRILAEQSGMIRIGITGSYEKTSTKNVIQAVLSEKYNSLMTPASFNTPMGITRTIREYMKPIHKVFVCEMG